MDQLIKSIIENLKDIKIVLECISEEQLRAPYKAFPESTIGKHVRHVIDYFEKILNGYDDKLVDFTSRQGNYTIENNKDCATAKLEELIIAISLYSEKSVQETICYIDNPRSVSLQLNTNLGCLFERSNFHLIHHGALITQQLFDLNVDLSNLPKTFGYNPTTKIDKKEVVQ